jgi:ribosome-binding factor A
MSQVRAARLGGTIQKLLSVELGRFAEAPRLAVLGISQVTLSADLGVATVAVRIMFGPSDQRAEMQSLKAVQAIAPRLRSSLARALTMRRVPELRFVYDHGEDHRRTVDRLLQEIESEPKALDD